MQEPGNSQSNPQSNSSPLEAVRTRAEMLARARRFSEAIEEFRRWIALEPANIAIRAELALMLLNENRTAEAGECASAALQIAPNDPAAHFALAQVYDALQQVDKAADHYEKSAENNPLDPRPFHRLAFIESRVGAMDEALDLWRHASKLAPNWRTPHDFLVQNLNYDPRLSSQQIFDEHLAWANVHAEPLTGENASHRFSNPRDPDRALRIGYVSPDFTNHPIASFLRPIFAAHDRKQYQAICFSDVAKAGSHTEDLKRLVDGWVNIVGQTDEQVLQLIRAQNIDVLFDLTGQLANNRLMVFARRAAPVQINYLGYCNTTGMSAMNWIILDDITDPPAGTQPYTENILRLPHGFSCYAPPLKAIEPNELPATTSDFITLGCFQRPKKLNDGAFDLFARLLHEIPRTKILFWRNVLFGRAAERIKSEMQKRDVSADRFEVINRQPPGGSHFAMYHAIDISLDTQPWSGHTTSCESTWMGVPYVTMRGKTHAGRMAASAMIHAGCEQFVSRDADDYIAIVKRLASDLPALASLRKSLRDRILQSDLCNANQFTREFESAIRTAWRAWCATP